MSNYRTKNQGLAGALRYALGKSAHVLTDATSGRGGDFVFEGDRSECESIATAYFSDHGEGGFPISDAKALIASFVEVRRTLSEAIRAFDGVWRNEPNER